MPGFIFYSMIIFEVIFIFIFIVVNLILFYIGITKNKELSEKYKELINSYNSLKEQKGELETEKRVIEKNIEVLKQSEEDFKNSIELQEQMSEKAFKNYYDMLEKHYEETEKEFDSCENTLKESYANLQDQLSAEIDKYKQDLDKIRATRAAAIQAQIKENEISEKSTFYCLTIPEIELKDIAILETIKPKLNNPRVLSMLIWQTYYRTPMTDLCNRVVGKTVKTGIYKITNQLTSECYVGQAVDIASRWKDHAKCGLGIDTPAKNKLYKAMTEYGLSHFSWEILEECERADLDEKEKFFIDLYQAKDFGYNSQVGNN